MKKINFSNYLVIFLLCFLLGSTFQSKAQEEKDANSSTKNEGQKEDELPPREKTWYEKIEIGGYAQLRYNRLLESNPDLKCLQCDESIGDNGGFNLKRVRVEFKGYLNDKIYYYLMPEFAEAFNHSALLREGWVDVGIGKDNTFRARVGLSRIPVGHDLLVDSRHRIAIDRTDAMNSAQLNERDLGVFVYYTPSKIKERIDHLVNSGLKGANDHGMLGIGAYNGQGGNTRTNPVSHLAARATYPFQTESGQYIEASLSGYVGKFDVLVNTSEIPTFDDQRVAASFIYYPQPFGITAEATYGVGPQFQADGDEFSIQSSELYGGYIQLMYFVPIKKHQLIPYARYQYYDGGKKFELDATRHKVNEVEFGAEWQIDKALRVNAGYVISNRTFENSENPFNQQHGNLLRLQIQAMF